MENRGVFVDFSNMSLNQARDIMLNQCESYSDFLEHLSSMSDNGRVGLVDSFTSEEIETKFGVNSLSDNVVIYRLCSLLRVLLLCDDCDLYSFDIVLRSHFDAIFNRLSMLNQKYHFDDEL